MLSNENFNRYFDDLSKAIESNYTYGKSIKCNVNICKENNQTIAIYMRNSKRYYGKQHQYRYSLYFDVMLELNFEENKFSAYGRDNYYDTSYLCYEGEPDYSCNSSIKSFKSDLVDISPLVVHNYQTFLKKLDKYEIDVSAFGDGAATIAVPIVCDQFLNDLRTIKNPTKSTD